MNSALKTWALTRCESKFNTSKIHSLRNLHINTPLYNLLNHLIGLIYLQNLFDVINGIVYIYTYIYIYIYIYNSVRSLIDF